MKLQNKMSAIRAPLARPTPVPKLLLDPRSKLLILILINITVFAAKDFGTEVFCVAMIALTLCALGTYRKALRGLFLYAGLLGILHLCGFLPDYIASMFSMLAILFRKLMPAVFFASGLVATTKVNELIAALQKIRIPKSLVITLAITLRFFPTLGEEYRCVKDAMKLRGIRLNAKNILLHLLALSEYLLIPLMLRCAIIADELSAAAMTRGIERNGKRTSLYELSFTFGDYAVLSLFSLLALFSLLGGFRIFI
ncbi:energy-coupling factor transporter transmembrane protein EcfT [Treponema phagedenis]|uniref:energy-coupling factor transporter transmembrane component T family protein n=1 Tax=Treponema phagedenis TaxID=162 RepID=UPI0011E747EA|nr:energy-coupling factor transporter transmembrane component T [Treponema phagedenis]QEJ96361.1 energy-coupling factor transporter transmembrane protein EcfT [Treponema phagedenis]